MGLPVLQELPDGSYLSEITNQPASSRTRIPPDKVADPRLAAHIPVRVVREYQVQTDPTDDTISETFRIITNILDHDELLATEIAQAYHENGGTWNSVPGKSRPYLRLGEQEYARKPPRRSRQELYGLFLAHYAIRSFMAEAANTVEIDLDRISFTRTLHIIRRRMSRSSESPSTRRTHHKRDLAEATERRNKRRSRTYPRGEQEKGKPPHTPDQDTTPPATNLPAHDPHHPKATGLTTRHWPKVAAHRFREVRRMS